MISPEFEILAVNCGLDKFASFMVYARQFPVKILAGVILLTSVRAGIQ